MPITPEGPTTTWGQALPVSGAPLIGAPLANPAAVMNEALERAERWAEVVGLQGEHAAVVSSSAPAQSWPRPRLQSR